MVKISIEHDENRWFFCADGQRVEVTPPPVRDSGWEKCGKLPVFQPEKSGWLRGYPPAAVAACECTIPGAFVPGSMQLKTAGGIMTENQDFITDPEWGCTGRTDTGKIGEDDEAEIRYFYYPSRVDSCILTGGKLQIIQGKEGMAVPPVPELPAGAVRLANILFRGKFEELTPEMIFPVTDDLELPLPEPQYLPLEILKKLKNGGSVNILAWGDSVTECGFLPDQDRWQEQFIERLRKAYPQAEITLQTAGKGGSRMDIWLDAPAGCGFNFAEEVLAKKPDLVISEFVNDAGTGPEKWQRNLSTVKKAFDEQNIRWVILTPHYVKRSWMRLESMKNCEQDPRPFVAYLRSFAEREQIPLADASVLWGRLFRKGIPYEILLVNGINHPNAFGMKLFADVLIKMFEPL